MLEWQTTSTILNDLRDHRNDEAWTRFAQRFRPPIVAFARRVGVPDTAAEDVAQDTLIAFAELYRQGRYDRQKGRLGKWLFGIAHTHVLRYRQADARRSAKVVSGMDSAFWQNAADNPEAQAAWDPEWEQAILHACLARVRREFSPEIIRAFEAAVSDTRPAAEVAQELGVSTKLIYNAKHRVMTRIRALRAEFEEID